MDKFLDCEEDYHRITEVVITKPQCTPTSVYEEVSIRGHNSSQSDSIVIIDEAYMDFAGSRHKLIDRYENFLLQTFSNRGPWRACE